MQEEEAGCRAEENKSTIGKRIRGRKKNNVRGRSRESERSWDMEGEVM